MKITWAVFVLLVCLNITATALSAETVKLVTTEIPPYTGNEITTTGFLSEIITSAFLAGGLVAQVDSMPWVRAKSAILMGKSDAIFPSSDDELEELNAAKTLIYKTSPIVLLKRKTSSVRWNGHVSSLKGYSIGMIKGFSYTKEFDNANFFTKSRHGGERNIVMLAGGRIDLAIMDELTAQFYIKKLQLADQIEIISPPLINSTEFYLGFSRSQRSRTKEQRAFNLGLIKIKKDGSYNTILKKYHVDGDIKLRAQEVEIVKFDKNTRLLKPEGSGVLPKVIKMDPAKMAIGFCGFHWQTDGYQQSYLNILQAESKRYGFTLIHRDAVASIDIQIQQIEDLIDKNVDVIAVWPVHGKKILPVLKKAKMAGIPVFVVNTPVDVSGFDLIRGYTGPNNVEEGRLAAQMMIEALEGKGTVVEIQGFPGYSTAIERSVGFSDELEQQKKLNPQLDIEIIDVIAGYWSREKAKQAAKRLTRRITHFDGLYVADDNMAIGAMESLQAAGRLETVKITSATLFGEGYDAIKAGKMYGSVWQNPQADARLAVEVAIKIIKGEQIQFFNFFDTPKVTAKNIEQFKRPNF